MYGSLNHWSSLFLIAAAQGIFLAVQLLLAKSFDVKNKMLGALIMLYSISLVDNVWFWSDYYLDYPHLLGISMTFPFLYGPLLYIYFKESMRSGAFNPKFAWKHLVLPAIVLLYLIPYYLSPASEKLDAIQIWNQSLINALIIPVTSILSMVFYGIIVYKLMIAYEQKSEASIIKFSNWLFKIFITYSLFVLLYVIYTLWIFTGLSTRQSDYIIALGSSFFIYFIGHLGFSKSKLLNGIKINPAKYQSSTLTPSAGQHLFDLIRKHLEETKIYTNSQLRLSGLADQLSLTPHQLSQVINENTESNFSDFINSYRIEEAKRRIGINTRINLLAIDVGFNNKTSFQLAFKKFAGCTPSEYRRMKFESQLLSN